MLGILYNITWYKWISKIKWNSQSYYDFHPSNDEGIFINYLESLLPFLTDLDGSINIPIKHPSIIKTKNSDIIEHRFGLLYGNILSLTKLCESLIKYINYSVVNPKNNYLGCFGYCDVRKITEPIFMHCYPRSVYNYVTEELIGPRVIYLIVLKEDKNKLKRIENILDLAVLQKNVRSEQLTEEMIDDMKNIDKIIKTDAKIFEDVVNLIKSFKYTKVHNQTIELIQKRIRRIKVEILTIKKKDEAIMWEWINKLSENEQEILNEIEWYHW